MKSVIRATFLFSILAINATDAFAVDPLEGRVNVMECSHAEISAYMALGDPERESSTDYDQWEAAFMSTEVKKAEMATGGVEGCLGMLYGDLTAMGDKLKTATQSLMSMSLPSMSEVMSQVTDEFTKSICSRAQAAIDTTSAAVIQQLDETRNMARRQLLDRYGQAAIEEYITDAVVSPELQGMGVEYRNGKIDRDSFRQSVKKRWQRELNELKDDATGG
jgi:hypothetical protein